MCNYGENHITFTYWNEEIGHIKTLSKRSTTLPIAICLRLLISRCLRKVKGIEPSQDAVDLVGWHPNLIQKARPSLLKMAMKPATAVSVRKETGNDNLLRNTEGEPCLQNSYKRPRQSPRITVGLRGSKTGMVKAIIQPINRNPKGIVRRHSLLFLSEYFVETKANIKMWKSS